MTNPYNDDLCREAAERAGDLYRALHQHPELSMREHRTAARVATELRRLGVEVTEGIGGTGVVGLLENGDGPTVLLRADMDGLPVREETGLEYASTDTAQTSEGVDVPVMHACGHDAHVAALIGALDVLTRDRGSWSGRVVAVFQPGEETAEGARAMVDDVLAKFGKPDVCLAQHVSPLPVGVVVSKPGTMASAAQTLRVRMHGRGGHTSTPENAVDPIVMAASAIVRLQSVVAREVSPVEQAVVTVASIRAGDKENVIPDHADFSVNVRAADPDVLHRVLGSIRRILAAEASASNAPQPPTIEEVITFPALQVDDASLERVREALVGAGAAYTQMPHPLSGSEDFGVFGDVAGAPSVFWHWGGIDPARFTTDDLEVLLRTARLPDTVAIPHSSGFAPAADMTLMWGVRLMVAAAHSWLATSSLGDIDARDQTTVAAS